MTTAPTLFALNDDELHAELQNLTVMDSIPVAGESMVLAGIRLDPLTGKHHPAVLIRCEGNDDLHVLALPDTGP